MVLLRKGLTPFINLLFANTYTWWLKYPNGAQNAGAFAMLEGKHHNLGLPHQF